ncbi:hypothetical protein MIR68_003757 [Amoeboaphelidium protococcarum]|nr:hypothetical protein MIR68_003757 [Amoeboaphelidium protococcarum]
MPTSDILTSFIRSTPDHSIVTGDFGDFYSVYFYFTWNGRPKSPVPIISDLRRCKAANKRKRKLRKSYGKLQPPDKPPVIAFGDAGVKHFCGNPPVPVKKFADESSRRALVVITPEYQTSKQHSLYHADLHWKRKMVMRCRYKKVKKILPGRRRAQMSASKLMDRKYYSTNVLIISTEESQSRFDV